MVKHVLIPSRSNNYIWALVNEHTKQALIVDPGESQPVIDWLEQNQYQLQDILITHPHYDHIEGLPHLIKLYQPNVYAAAADHIEGTTHPLHGDEELAFPYLNLTFQVLSVPGHTQHHLAYYAAPYLFCGDTLFSVGCGRVLQGTIEDLYHSLQRLKSLPDNTLVCCAHEYTLNNIAFAKTVDATNAALLQYEQDVQQLRNQHQPSLPSLLCTEKQVNPFLRTDNKAIQQAVTALSQQPVSAAFDTFKALRTLKDNF